jgi:hypothetical protein
VIKGKARKTGFGAVNKKAAAKFQQYRLQVPLLLCSPTFKTPTNKAIPPGYTFVEIYLCFRLGNLREF